ncbi:MAG: DNA primase [Lachnospiraceae bacterium]|nr:DNA primase [Lachnospiraceae bacterium]
MEPLENVPPNDLEEAVGPVFEFDEEESGTPPYVDKNGHLVEANYASIFIARHPMKCFNGRLFTLDGPITDEAILKRVIAADVIEYIQSGVARRVNAILELIKILCAEEPPAPQCDRIHVMNGTLFTDGYLSEEKEFCLNRMRINYDPCGRNPEIWMTFLIELLYEEDIPTLQEFMGYMLIPTTRAQKMLLLIGKGGEGKSRIGLVLREILGDSMNVESLSKIETNRFARADLEYKLVMVDDDMKMEALPQTNVIKSLVTMEDKVDIERKGIQSTQGTLYVRFACFSNGSLQALYDRSDAFYRRQIIITTKDKPTDRVDDPFLIDKLRNEKEGIFLWMFRGLQRLIANNYRFTISERAKRNLEEAKEDGNNIISFLQSEGYFKIEEGAKCRSTDFYKKYETWCSDSLEKAFASKTFLHYLRENQQRIGIIYDEKVDGRYRGFHNVNLHPFVTVTGRTPFDG